MVTSQVPTFQFSITTHDGFSVQISKSGHYSVTRVYRPDGFDDSCVLPPFIQAIRDALREVMIGQIDDNDNDDTMTGLYFPASLPSEQTLWLSDTTMDAFHNLIIDVLCPSLDHLKSWIQHITIVTHKNRIIRSTTPIMTVLRQHHFTLFLQTGPSTYRFYDPFECRGQKNITLEFPSDGTKQEQIDSLFPSNKSPQEEHQCFRQTDTFMCGYFVMFALVQVFNFLKNKTPNNRDEFVKVLHAFVQQKMTCQKNLSTASKQRNRQAIFNWVIDSICLMKSKNKQNHLHTDFKRRTNAMLETVHSLPPKSDQSNDHSDSMSLDDTLKDTLKAYLRSCRCLL